MTSTSTRPRPAPGPFLRSRTLVGRSEEMAQLAALVEEGVSPITLTGPPGVGKSHLAAAFLDRWASSAAVEPVFCELARCESERDLVSTVAAALDQPLRARNADEARRELGDALSARRRTVLVLDGFEHLPPECARMLADWCAAAPDVIFVVTSRVRLRVRSERILPVPPLPFAEEGTAPTNALRSSAAIELFVRAARAAGAVLDDGDPAVLGEVAAIVRRLEGLPLGIELAASRVRSLGLPDLRRALEASIDSAGRGAVDAPLRHRSLRGAVDASLVLLGEEQADVLARLTRFAGPFTLEDAAAVLGGDGQGIGEALEGLVDASLLELHASGGAAEPAAYAMHAVLREIAAERIDSVSREKLAEAHARRFAQVASTRALDHSTRALEAIARGAADLRLAWRWAMEGPPDRERVGLASDLVTALARLVDRRGPLPELVEMIGTTRAAADVAGVDGTRRARLELALGYAHWERGAVEEAAAVLRRASELAMEAGDRRTEAMAATLLAVGAVAQGQAEEAEALAARARRAAEEAGDLWVQGLVLGAEATLAFDRGDRAGAREGHSRAKALHARVGDRLLESLSLGMLGNFAQDEGSLDEARRCYEEAVEVFVALRTRASEGIFRGYLATALEELGLVEEASAAFLQAITTLRECGHRRFEALFRAAHGGLLASAGDLRAARDEVDQAAFLADASHGSALRRVVELHRGRLEVATAERLGADRRDERNANVARAFQRLCALDGDEEGPSDDVRFARRMLLGDLRAVLGRPLPEHDPETWIVAWQATALRCGDTDLDLAQRRPLRRVLWRLVLKRLEEPGAVLGTDALVAAGWPGERMLPDAAAHRLRVALSTLRKMGLRDILETREEGYRLAPTARLRLEPPGPVTPI